MSHVSSALVNAAAFRSWRRWLRTQERRQDTVGDFARDYLADDCASQIRTLSSLDRHLRDEHGADDKVLTARDRAWREWQASRWTDAPDVAP